MHSTSSIMNRIYHSLALADVAHMGNHAREVQLAYTLETLRAQGLIEKASFKHHEEKLYSIKFCLYTYEAEFLIDLSQLTPEMALVMSVHDS